MKPLPTLSILLATASATIAQLSPSPAPPPSLTPTGNPGAATAMRTLQQVEPRIPINSQTCPDNNANNANNKALFRITKPGSYYLTGNINGTSGQNGIAISSGDVTLDLCGFVVEGGQGSLHGIITAHDAKSVAIFNGTLKDWGRSGITNNGGNGLVSDIRAVASGEDGINVRGIVERCVATGGTEGSGTGIRVSGNAHLCSSERNTGTGLTVTDGTASSCSANHNAGGGITAVDSIVRNCTAYQNNGDGIFAIGHCLIDSCMANLNINDDNNAAGIRVVTDTFSSESRVSNNLVTQNNFGIVVTTVRCIITGNSSTGNTPDSGTTDTDYKISAGNMVGKLIKIPTTAAAVDSNTANLGGTLTGANADPFANFYD